MKVIHLISGGDSGGARTHVHLLLKYLNREIDATLVCFMDGPFAQDAAALGIPTVVIGGNPVAALRRLKSMIRAGGYELVHCHGSRGNLMGALLKHSLGIPVISTVHSDPHLDYLGRLAARLTYGTLNAWALRRMDYYVGVSDAMCSLLIARGFDANRIFPIYNGVEFETENAAQAGERRAFLKDIGWEQPEDAVIVGIAARLHPVKDIPTLLRGFAAAYAEQPQLRLLIAGDGQDASALRALAQELGIGAVTRFAGWVSDMAGFYRAIDINTLTSRSETFPYAITEGARAKLPTVSSRVGGVPALVRPGETGYLFEPGDHAALGRHLAALAASGALRRRLGDALYQKARAEFSAEATCRTQREIYARVLRSEARERSGRWGILVCGAYGMSNAGDEAILGAVVAELRSIDPERPITVLTRRTAETAQRCGVRAVYSFDLPGILRRMRKSELFVNGGGSLIQDVTSTRSLLYYLYTLRAAKRRGCRVMMYGCGVGPVRRAGNRALAGRIINRYVDAITLREEHSLQELRSYGVSVPEITVASDPALSLHSADAYAVEAAARALGMAPEERYFCLCVRRWPGMQEKLPFFAAAADYAWERWGMRPLLMSINPQQDNEVLSALRGLIHAPCLTATEELAPDVLIGLMERMALVVSMRLHLLIFAASRAVPLAGISYDPKVAAFLDYIAQENCLDYDALTDAAVLKVLIDRTLGADKAALRARTAEIVAVEQRNVEIARQLLEA